MIGKVMTYTTVDPKANRKLISSLNAGGADDVDGQAVLVDRATKVLGIGTVKIGRAHV